MSCGYWPMAWQTRVADFHLSEGVKVHMQTIFGVNVGNQTEAAQVAQQLQLLG